MSIGGIAAEALRQFIERIERLEEEKKALQGDIKDVYSQAGSQGFDKKIIRKIVALRRQSPDERQEEEQLIELYKAVLGMSGGNPLSDKTRDRLSNREEDDDDGDEMPPPEAPPPGASVDEARSMGRAAAEEGKPVTSNPFPAGDPRRAAWDEEWCKAAGSDGMEIPDAWKRKAPKKKKEHE